MTNYPLPTDTSEQIAKFLAENQLGRNIENFVKCDVRIGVRGSMQRGVWGSVRGSVRVIVGVDVWDGVNMLRDIVNEGEDKL